MTLAPNSGDQTPSNPSPGNNTHVLVIVCNAVIGGLASLYVTTQSITVVVIAAGLVMVLAVLVVLVQRRS